MTKLDENAEVELCRADEMLLMKTNNKTSQKRTTKGFNDAPLTAVAIGTRIEKTFPGYPDAFLGTAVQFLEDTKTWLILYDDGDEEELETAQVQQLQILAKLTIRTSPTKKKQKSLSKPLLWSSSSQRITNPNDFIALPGFTRQDSLNMADFYLFCRERQSIWQRRTNGEPKPWSQNEVFNTHHFCNIYRELDRGTAFFRTKLLDLRQQQSLLKKKENISQWTHQVLWMSYCYRQVNRVDSLQETGLPQENNLKVFFRKMDKFRKTGGSFFTSAHQTTQYEGLKRYLKATEGNLQPFVDLICSPDRTLRDIHKKLLELMGIGSFLAWQIMCDLQEAGCIEFDNIFCEMGPGAKDGLNRIFSKSSFQSKDPLVRARILVSMQDLIFDQLGVSFPCWRKKRLSLKEIEHALCEYSKYKRLESGAKTMVRKYKSRDSGPDEMKCASSCEFDNPSGRCCVTCNRFFCENCEGKIKKRRSTFSCKECHAFEKRRRLH